MPRNLVDKDGYINGTITKCPTPIDDIGLAMGMDIEIVRTPRGDLWWNEDVVYMMLTKDLGWNTRITVRRIEHE